MSKQKLKQEGVLQGHLGGSVVECLPLAQVMILGSWDQVLHGALREETASPSAYVSASLCVSLMSPSAIWIISVTSCESIIISKSKKKK